jgi:aminoglycoside phosphotransferase (APT) family kinase protein
MEGEGMLDPVSAEGRAALADLLARETGEAAEIVASVPLSGGASSLTWRLQRADGRHLIFQRTASDAHGGLPRSAQGALMRRAAALGVPVAPVLAVPAPEDGLGDAIITGFVAGEALAPRWLRDPAYAEARALLLGQCAQALARLHAAPLDQWADLPLGGGSGAELLDGMFALYRRLGVDVPAFDLAFAWLRPRMPTEPAMCLAHGDFRSGNFLVAPSGLAAVLDWELAHLSVPEEDLGWLCVQAWRFGQWQQPVGGFGRRADLLAAYAAAGGRPVSRERLHIWEVFGTLRWGMSCLQLADDHVSGRFPSVERAAIGRRATEVAADLVHLLIHGEV